MGRLTNRHGGIKKGSAAAVSAVLLEALRTPIRLVRAIRALAVHVSPLDRAVRFARASVSSNSDFPLEHGRACMRVDAKNSHAQVLWLFCREARHRACLAGQTDASEIDIRARARAVSPRVQGTCCGS